MVTSAIGVSVLMFSRYLQLAKPRIVALITFTALVGMLLARPGIPPLDLIFWSSLGITLAAGCSAVLNQIFDRRLDEMMARTRGRPLPTGRVSEAQAMRFATALGVLGMLVLVLFVNLMTAVLTFGALIGYGIIYTIWLKRATPQNIVIGGAAGAAAPVLGWTAVTGHLDPNALNLFLIILLWTPPHFWSLAIARRREYARAGVPMLPVTHGVEHTCTQVLVYTVLLTFTTAVPFFTGMSRSIYLVSALLLDGVFLNYAVMLKRAARADLPMKVFRYSINYLMALFAAFLVDHFC